MDFVPTLILFLLTFTVIIAVHEFGHYLTARLLGMKVLEFAFGFPPRIAAIRHAGIDYSLNAIPFGGFVRILGQDDFRVHQAGEGDPGSFTSKPWWAQAIVLAAGVTMNMVLALVVLTIAFTTGTTASTGDVRVDQVAPGSPAEKAGVHVGDIVRAIDGREIKRSGDLVSYVTSQARLHPDQEVTLQLERSGRALPPIKAVPRAEPPEGEGPLGIRLEEVQGAVAVALPEAFQQALSLSGQDRAGRPVRDPDVPQARRRSFGEPRGTQHHPVPGPRRRTPLLRATRRHLPRALLAAGRGGCPRGRLPVAAAPPRRRQHRRHPPRGWGLTRAGPAACSHGTHASTSGISAA